MYGLAERYPYAAIAIVAILLCLGAVAIEIAALNAAGYITIFG
jgi:hypothetical protein